MAKIKTEKTAAKKRKTGGPFLAVAVFCEGILEDMHGGLTVQRIIDSVNLLVPANAPADLPSKANPVHISQNILLTFRTGNSPGKHTLKLVVEQPNGKRTTAMEETEVELSPTEYGGLNVKTNASMKVFSSGVFWIDVILDGKRVTRMPLNVAFNRVNAGEAITVPKIAPKK